MCVCVWGGGFRKMNILLGMKILCMLLCIFGSFLKVKVQNFLKSKSLRMHFMPF